MPRSSGRTGAAGLAVLLLGLALALPAAEAPAAAGGTCQVLIAVGLAGSPVHARRFADWAGRFQAWFTAKAGLPADHVTVLGAAPAGGAAPSPATAEATLAQVRRSAGVMRPEDQFVLVLLGHGSVTDGAPKFLLTGPDLPLADLATALEPMRAGNQAILLLTSASGDTITALASPGRAVVTATSPGETAEPVFAEFFLRGLESGAADGAGGDGTAAARDGTVTLLEAFNHAAGETPRWIRRIRKDGDGDDWLVSGRDSVALFKALCEAPAESAGGRHLSLRSRADIPDPEVPLATPAKELAAFAGVRVVGEHASLEDAGTAVGAAPLQGGQFRPLAGTTAGEPGALARRIVLGKAALLPGGPP